jgi:hypothetical protein
MQNENSRPQENASAAPVPNALARPWLVTIAIFLIVGAILKDLVGMCASVEETTLPLVFIGLLYDAFQGYVAWGLWQMKEFARKGLIAIVAIDALSLVVKLAADAEFNPAVVLFAIALGLILRGAFIFWFMNNPQLFSIKERSHETLP